MANRTPTNVLSDTLFSVVTTTWTPMLNGDTGLPIQFAQNADRSVQITGTFGAGGSVQIQGSNDGTNYSTLNSLQGTALNITSASIVQIQEITGFLRPVVTAGDGSTSLTVTVIGKRNQPY